MSPKLAVVRIIQTAEPVLCGGPQLSGPKERLTLLPVATQPPLAVTIANLERPRQILDLHELSQERHSRIWRIAPISGPGPTEI